MINPKRAFFMRLLNSLSRLVPLLFLFLGNDSCQCAKKFFSRDSAKFIKEYSSYVGQINSEEIKREIKLFQTYWSTGEFSKKELGDINQLANSMLLVGMKPDPYFLLLTKCLNAYVTNDLKKKVLTDFISISSQNYRSKQTWF